jgi:hypothetical protein
MLYQRATRSSISCSMAATSCGPRSAYRLPHLLTPRWSPTGSPPVALWLALWAAFGCSLATQVGNGTYSASKQPGSRALLECLVDGVRRLGLRERLHLTGSNHREQSVAVQPEQLPAGGWAVRFAQLALLLALHEREHPAEDHRTDGPGHHKVSPSGSSGSRSGGAVPPGGNREERTPVVPCMVVEAVGTLHVRARDLVLVVEGEPGEASQNLLTVLPYQVGVKGVPLLDARRLAGQYEPNAAILDRDREASGQR